MAVTISNISSLQAQRHLRNVMISASKSILRLTTGLRINSAADDAAGLQISNRLSSEINGLYQANRNASDGIAFAQTAEGAMDEITNMLHRIRTLAVQSSNGTYTADDRAAIQQEVGQLSEEITRIAQQTKYGGQTLLMGTASGMGDNGIVKIQVGAYSGDTIDIDISQSMELSALTQAAQAKVGDNSLDNLLNANNQIDVSTVDAAQTAITGVDALLSIVNSSRAGLGAVQNRLDSVIRINSNTHANLSDARSRIRDTDYAEESANLMRQNILQQSAMSMLMQANSRPNLILQLLGGI